MLRATRTGRAAPSGGPELPSVCLNTGASMPLMAFGTYLGTLDPDPDSTRRIIEEALEVGYRHLYTAQVYNTESMIGEAIRNKIKDGTIKREDVFVTTKLWRTAHQQQDAVPSLKASLRRLGLDYVDLFLVHYPTAFKPGEDMFPKEDGKFVYANIDYLDTWKGMEACVDQGLCKAIGLSNFNSKQIQRLLDHGRIAPANLQIEVHPYLTNTKLIKYCHEKAISVMAYSPLFGFNQDFRDAQGWTSLHEDSVIISIAKKHKATPAQVALRYQIQRGIGVCPKTSKRNRMEENFSSQLMVLTDDDMEAIDSCNRNFRLNPECPDHPHYPFHEEF